MIGQTWPSEIREFRDRKTGRPIKQLTSQGNNVHFYFTENSFDAGENAIIFKSDRATGADRAPHENPSYNVFRMDLDSGEILAVDLPRPRNRIELAEDPAYVHARKEVLDFLYTRHGHLALEAA